MLLHIRPRLFSSFFRQVTVVDLRIAEFDLHLVGGIDLVTRHPYPNRGYFVVCRREGRNKRIDGIFIEMAGWIEAFRCVTRWAFESAWVVEHTVHYKLLDRDFDAASDDMTLWNGYHLEDGGWPDRRPAWALRAVPCRSEPVMHVLPEDRDHIGETDDEEDEAGWIVRRRQRFAMPTIERERLLAPELGSRRPGLASAFRLAGSVAEDYGTRAFDRPTLAPIHQVLLGEDGDQDGCRHRDGRAHYSRDRRPN